MAAKEGLRPWKLSSYTPKAVDTSLFPAKFLVWNTCHDSHIRKLSQAQKRVLYANEVPSGLKGLDNKLPFPDIPPCKRYLISGPL